MVRSDSWLLRHLRTLAVALIAIPIFSSFAFAAWPHNPSINVPVAVGSGNRQHQVAVADGSGGIYVAWEDYRSGTSRIYAQHLLADGSVAPGWAANGNVMKIDFPSRTLTAPAICSDDAGGVIVAWAEAINVFDHDIFAQRMNAGGAILWGSNGTIIAASGYDQLAPRIVDDGTGSILAIWQEDHSGDGPPTGSDVYANRVGAGGAVRWGVNGVIVCNASGDQTSPNLVSDGAGGFDAAWQDRRSNNGLFATRRDSTGALHAGWTVNGTSLATGNYAFSAPMIVGNSTGGFQMVWTDDRSGLNAADVFSMVLSGNGSIVGGTTLCNSFGSQVPANLVSDGADGAWVAWTDNRSGTHVYALHLGSSGVPVSGSTPAGVPITAGNPGNQAATALARDGAGGCIVAITDDGAVRTDVYATRLTGSGTVTEGWSLETAICTAPGDHFFPVCVSDGASGAILAWQDTRDGISYEIFAQNVDRFGQLGDASPAIVGVKDVLGDQGGRVRVSWNASWLDAGPGYAIGSYWLWREVPAAAALADLRAGRARLEGEGDSGAASRRVLRTSMAGTLVTYWEYVTSQVANAFPSYSIVASTTTDSSASSNPTTLFMVEARGPGHESWDSAPLAGYSVDNLAPPAPAPFQASYSAGTTQLHWTPPSAPDLASYRLYRGATSGFSPDPAHRIGSPDDTVYADVPGGFYYYRVSAVDLHGNEGPTSLAFPTSATAVGDPPAFSLALAGAEPNPVRASAMIRWTLPRAGHVRVTLLDLAGRRIRTVADEVRPAGANAVRWDVRDDDGRIVTEGIYFVRLEAEGRVLRARAAIVR